MKKRMLFALAVGMLTTQSYGITKEDYAHRFKGYRACFMLYDIDQAKIVTQYNPGLRCHERLSPDSTFKIPLSLMAFNQNIMDQETIFKWDGKEEALPGWNQNQTAKTWFQYSVVWVSQQITQQLGMARVKHYLAGFNYGNQNFSGDPGTNNGLTHAWLASSLKISAVEQLHFLIAMALNELPLHPDAITKTHENMYLGKLDNGANYYGKTGSGRHGRNERLSNPSKLRDGWFVGFVEQDAHHYVFVSNLTDITVPKVNDKYYGSQILKPITIQILNDYFAGK